MKEIYASATPKTNIICWKQEQIYFSTEKLTANTKKIQLKYSKRFINVKDWCEM